MILITTCPACQTQFEVNDAQLQAHAGQVRCGACEQVFDARATLLALEAEEDASASKLLSDGHDHVLMAEPDPQPDLTDSSAPADNAELPHSGLDAVEDQILASGADNDLPADTDIAEVGTPEDTLTETTDFPSPDETPGDTETNHSVPAFLQTVGEASAVALSRRQRVGYAMLIVLLICLAVAQSVYLLRQRVASLFPASQPWLVQMCQHLHCSMGLPRQIQQLVIDDADIQEQPDHAHVLVFSSVLINHGDQAQAFPDIELTLTGTGDEALFRRRIPPADYLPSSFPVTAGIAAHQEVRVQALLAVEDQRVAGYRVAIDYP